MGESKMMRQSRNVVASRISVLIDEEFLDEV